MPDHTTVKITPLTEQDALYKRYDEKPHPQPCHLTLDLRDGEFTADYNPELPADSARPGSVVHGLWRWIPLPGPLTNDAANQLLNEAAGLAQRILDGADTDWDGHNTVAVLNDDAARAEEELADLAQSYDDPHYLIGEIGARDWYCEGDPPADVTADTTDAELDAIAAREAADARTVGDGVTIVSDLWPYLASLRQEARDRVYADLTETAEQIGRLEGRRDDLMAQVRRWRVASLRDIGQMAGLSHTHVKRITDAAAKRFVVDVGTDAQAEWLAGLDWLVANGERPTVDGSKVTLRRPALDLLAEHCGPDDDGHYDGTYVWMGGSEYEVRPA